MSWFEERFTEMHGRIHTTCVVCSRSMWFPKSKLGLYKTCGGDCADQKRAEARKLRERQCATCGKSFTPRYRQIRMGHGVYCSQKCNEKSHIAMNSKEAQARAREQWRKTLESGAFNQCVGERHPNWRGGREACRKRLIESGVSAARTRAYRKNNPHKIREFSSRRKARALNRLPNGTVKRLGELQKWKCAICRKNVKRKFHVDHIMPLALGGPHEPSNLQLLCPTCNLRKSAKHPVDYMQEQGWLL